MGHDELAEQKEINKEISQSIEELQSKLPFLNQKAVKNEIPAPTGNNVPLVVVDVENAESLWNKNADDMALALQGFQSTARRICKKYNGFEAPVEEEKMTFGFSQAPAALSFAVELQQELNDFEWPETYMGGREEFMKGIPAVVALHNGTAAFVEGKYTGPATRVIQRLISATRGGEILTTQHAWSQAVEELPKELVDVIKRNELGSFEVKEINAPIDILQIFPDSLKSDNESLKVKLVATEEQAKKARDRALELNKWLNESRNEMRTTIGEQIQAAMAEVASLIRESETLEKELKRTTQQLNGARKVMDGMNGKMQEMSQKNNLLRSQVVEQERQQQHLSAEITRLEELLNTKKKSFISKLMPGKLKRGSSVADNKKTLEGNADLKKSKVDPKKQSKRATKKMSEEKAEDAEIVDEKKGKKEKVKKNKKEEEKKRKEEEKKHKKDDKKHKKDEKEEKKDEKKDEKEEKEDEKKDEKEEKNEEKEEKEEEEEKSEKSEKKEEDEKRDKVEKDEEKEEKSEKKEEKSEKKEEKEEKSEKKEDEKKEKKKKKKEDKKLKKEEEKKKREEEKKRKEE